jgi:hypothetical protein
MAALVSTRTERLTVVNTTRGPITGRRCAAYAAMRQRAMEHRIVGGERVESAEIEDLQNQARHESLMVRTHAVMGRLAHGWQYFRHLLPATVLQ